MSRLKTSPLPVQKKIEGAIRNRGHRTGFANRVEEEIMSGRTAGLLHIAARMLGALMVAFALAGAALAQQPLKIGRASCRERVWIPV